MSSQAKPADRRSRKRLQTRGAILVAAEQLFAARAMEGVSIDEIVDVADVSKGSFYNHFLDKEALARAIVDGVQDDIEAEIGRTNLGIDDPAIRIVRALAQVLAYRAEHPDRLQALLSLSERRTVADTPLNAGLALDVKRGIEQGTFQGIDLETGVLVVTGLVLVTLRHAVATGRTTPAQASVETMGAAMLRGLGVERAAAAALARAACTAEALRSPPPRPD